MRRPERMSAAEYRASIGKEPVKSDAGSTQNSFTGADKPDGKQVQQSPKKPSATNLLTKALIALLAMRGCHVWRQNNGGQWDAKINAFRSGSSTPGISDIIGYEKATGRMIAVEVKSKTDRLSGAQTAFLAGIEKAGGFAVEGRSVEQVSAAFDLWAKK